jgi:hypothetical protein
MIREIVVSLPFAGLWLARNSPARRVPSHGIDVSDGIVVDVHDGEIDHVGRRSQLTPGATCDWASGRGSGKEWVRSPATIFGLPGEGAIIEPWPVPAADVDP